ncbi:MAG: alanine:cation symporter family protein [Clostridia bacterium]|nr:alanine:cation symporter family protein [Clostridia bacterium]
MERWIEYLCTHVIWGLPLTALIVVFGLRCAMRSRGRFLAGPRRLKRAFGAAGEGLRPFEAFALTVGGKIGVGNIVGVGLALETGGPGALLWMAVFSLLGAALSYTECSTAARLGGAAPTFLRRLGNPRAAKVFGILTAAAMTVFMPSIQVNAAARAVLERVGGGRHTLLLVGGAMAAAFLLCACFGRERIARVSAVLMPPASAVTLLVAVAVIVACRQRLPQVLLSVWNGAFGGSALTSGAAAAAFSTGVRRAMFSCEAGYGIAPFAAAKTAGSPRDIGLIQGFGVIFDTLIMCTLTGVMMLCAGTTDAADAFGLVLGEWGGALLTAIVVLFAFTTLLSCAFTAVSDADVWGGRLRACQPVVMAGVIVCSACAAPQVVWALCDGVCGVMAAMNLTALWRLERGRIDNGMHDKL